MGAVEGHRGQKCFRENLKTTGKTYAPVLRRPALGERAAAAPGAPASSGSCAAERPWPASLGPAGDAEGALPGRHSPHPRPTGRHS